MPWDLEEELEGIATPLILDIREPYEFDCIHIDGSSNVSHGVLERTCEWGLLGNNSGSGKLP